VTEIVCGVDVSKRRLDAHVAPSGTFESFSNDAAGISALAAFCRRQGVQLVVMEASGGYERSAFLLLWEAGIPCGLTNPKSVRRYAEAMGILEKTGSMPVSSHASRSPKASSRQARRPRSSSVSMLWSHGCGRSPMTSQSASRGEAAR
jgi:transposase